MPGDEGIHRAKGHKTAACSVGLPQCSREPGWGAEGSSGSVTYFCHIEVRICWGPGRTDTGSPGSHPGRCTSHCHHGRLSTEREDRPRGPSEQRVPFPKGSRTLPLRGLTSWNSDSSLLEMTLWDSLGLLLVSGRKLQ